MRGRYVELQRLGPQHIEGLRRICAGPRESFRWTSVPTPEGVEAYVAYAVAQMERGAALAFATCSPDGEVLGSTRLFDLQRWDWPEGTNPRAGLAGVYDGAEIGWTWLAPHAQRTPVNTEAKLLMLAHAFETWRCFRVTLKTDARNEQSRRAIERLGARLDGVLRSFQPGMDGRPRDSAYYTIVAAEWPAVKAALTARLARG